MADPLNQLISSLEGAEIPSQTKVYTQPLIEQNRFHCWKREQGFSARSSATPRKALSVSSPAQSGIEAKSSEPGDLPPVCLPRASEPTPKNGLIRASYRILPSKRTSILGISLHDEVASQPSLSTVISRVNGYLSQDRLSLAEKIIRQKFGQLPSGQKILDALDGLRTASSAFSRQKFVLIACTHFWPCVGGIETIAENLGSGLVQLGYTVDVATIAHPDRRSHGHRGTTILSLTPDQMINGKTLWSWQIRDLVTSGDYAACILLSSPLTELIWCLENASIPPETRLIVQPVINREEFGQWKDNPEVRSRFVTLLRKATAVVSITQNGIDTAFFREEQIPYAYLPNAAATLTGNGNFRIRYGIKAEDFLILQVANLYRVKNHIALMQALDNAPSDWKLVIVGRPAVEEPVYADEFQQALRRHPEVLHIPGLPPEEIASALDAADLVVLSSRSEAAPVSILEAMSHHKPWLATSQCGAVVEYAGGIVVPLEQFPQTIRLLQHDAGLLRELGQLGYAHWQSSHSWPVVIKGWQELVETGQHSLQLGMPEEIRSRMHALTSSIQAKGLIDELGMADITHPKYGIRPACSPRFETDEFAPGQAFVVKKSPRDNASQCFPQDISQTALVAGPAQGEFPGLNRHKRVVAIMSAFNEGDVIYHVVGDLITNGIHVYLIDDHSTDNTVEEASKWLGKGLLEIERFNRPVRNGRESNCYEWSALLGRKEQLAAELGADWYIHADADEFRESPWPGFSLSEGIQLVDSQGYNTINFELLNFRPTNNCFLPGSDVRQALTGYETTAWFDALQVKAWKNLGSPVRLQASGGHSVEFQGRKIFPIPFILRHYPVRSDAHGRRKIWQERMPRFSPEERAKGWHVQYDEFHQARKSFLWDPNQLISYDGNAVRAKLLAQATQDLLLRGTFSGHGASADRVDLAAVCAWAGNLLGFHGPLPTEQWQEGERVLESMIRAPLSPGAITVLPSNSDEAAVVSLVLQSRLALARLQGDATNVGRLLGAQRRLAASALVAGQAGLDYSSGGTLHSPPPEAVSGRPLDVIADPGDESMKVNIEASIIIPIHNQWAFTNNCLTALYANTHWEGGFEVIVVDDASTDGSAQNLREHSSVLPRLRIIANPDNQGFAKSCNRGAAVARGKFLVFLNNDTEPLLGWLEAPLHKLERDPGIGIVGCKLLYPDRSIQHCGIEFFKTVNPEYPIWPHHRHMRIHEDDPRGNCAGEVQAVTGACLFIRKSLFGEVGMFSTEYRMYFEDIDLCFKIRQRGLRVYYEPTSVVIHHESQSSPSREQVDLLNLESAKVFFRKWASQLVEQGLLPPSSGSREANGPVSNLVREYPELARTCERVYRYLREGKTALAQKVFKKELSHLKEAEWIFSIVSAAAQAKAVTGSPRMTE
jgi:GT2 family glycosyltransferase/glycosyltransferase involved in cell wall biosynthesis